MKKILVIMFVLFAVGTAEAVERWVMPDTPNTGSIGSKDHPWRDGHINNLNAPVVRSVPLALDDFYLESNGLPGTVGNGITAITSSSQPGIEFQDGMKAIVWADGETTPASVTFRVPSDYKSGGGFRLIATTSAATTEGVDFNVLVNTVGTTFDTTLGAQSVTSTGGSVTTPGTVTLDASSEFIGDMGDKLTTFRMWRDNVGGSTSNLELRHAEFFYTATQ